MRPILALFAACCGFLATLPDMALAASSRDRIAALSAVDGQLVLHMETGRDIVPAHLYLPRPDHAVKQLQSWQGAGVTVTPQGTDRYGRMLAIVTRVDEKKPLQEYLLEQGGALVYSPTAFRQSTTWLAAEKRAAAARRGIWEPSAQQELRLFLQPDDAQQAMQQFVQVTGVVTRTYKARDAYYINFGDDWKTDFSIKIPRKAWRAFGEQLEVQPAATVQARGVIIDENGPMLVLSRPEQMQVR